MADPFSQHAVDLDSPGAYAAAVMPSETVDLTFACRALWVGTAGDIKVLTVGGDTVTFIGFSGWLPLRCARVFSTGTTASNIVAVR